MSTSLIRFDDVTKSFGSPEAQVTALHALSLEIVAGSRIGLIGPNGAGKTTLLRLLLGLLQPSSGALTRDPSMRPGSDKIACVLDAEGVYPDMSASDNFAFFGALYGLTAAKAVARGHAILDRFDLRHRAEARVSQLSRGQQKIVSLARAVLAEPQLLIVDELTACLDPGNQRTLVNYLLERNETHATTILFASHHLAYVEEIATQLVLIVAGHKCLDLAPAQAALTCFEVATTKGDREVRSRLADEGIPFFPMGAQTLRLVLPGREGAMRIRKLGFHAEPQAASLEDVYQAYVYSQRGGAP